MIEKANSRSSAVVGENIENTQRYLREREHQLRVLTDYLPGHIAYVGADDLRYRFVNQKFETSCGRFREEIIGKHIKEIIGESNYEYALKYIAEVRAGKSTSYVNVFNLAQGRRWVQVNYAPDLDEQGNVKNYRVTRGKKSRAG
jgi:PAS domain S-box-containing protein